MGTDFRKAGVRILGAGALLALAIGPAWAQMTAVTQDGRTVILNEDFTWRYAQGAGSGGGFVLDNWNRAACERTRAATFELEAETPVAEVITWIDWRGLSGVRFRLTDGGWEPVAAGALTRGSCDSYQPNWCEGRVRVDRALAAGTYQLEIDAERICRNSGSQGRGFIRVTRGAGGAAATPSRGGYAGIAGRYRTNDGGGLEIEIVDGRVQGTWSNGARIVEAKLVGNRLSGTYRYRPGSAIATFDFTFTPDWRCYEGPWRDVGTSGIEKGCRED